MTTSSPSSRADALVIGEALVDVVDGVAHPGGSPANVAVALGRQGVAVTLATQLADDAEGRIVRDHLAASNVDLVIAPARRTSRATAVVGPDGAASYDFDVSWDPTFPELPDARIVHVGSFSALDVELPEATLSYDVNVRPALLPDDSRRHVERIVERATIVKASDEDLVWLYPDRPPEDSARALLALGPQVVWLTRGAEGAVGFTTDGAVAIPPRPVHVVDTIGAGDTFSAGLILGWLRWVDDWERVGELAARLSADACTRPGADPPWA